MSIVGKAGEYGHNNPDFAFVDSDFIRGGGRVVTDVASLYALATKADQLKEKVTEVYVRSLGYKMRLKDITNINNSAGWEQASTPLPQGLSPTDTPTFAGLMIANHNIVLDNDQGFYIKDHNGFPQRVMYMTNADELQIGSTAGSLHIVNTGVYIFGTTHSPDQFPQKYQFDGAVKWENIPPGTALRQLFYDETTGIISYGTCIFHFRGKYTSLSALQTSMPTGNDGDYAVITGSPNDQEYIWDSDHASWVLTANIPAGSFAGLAGSPNDNGALAAVLGQLVDKTTNQTIGGNKTFTGLTSIQSTTPEQRFITSGDSAYAKFERTTISNNNLFLGKNQVVQIGGIGKAIRLPTGSTGILSANDAGFPTGTSVTFTYSIALRAPTETVGSLVICGWGSVTYLYLIGTNFGLQDQVGGTSLFQYNYGSLFTDKQWHNFIFTINGAQGKLYIDGNLVSIQTLNRTYNMTVLETSGAFTIGPYGGTMSATMDIDQILLYNRVLSPTSGADFSNEINVIYNSGGYTASPPTIGLIRRYELEEGTGPISADINPNATQYPLTLINSPSWLSVGIVPVSSSSAEAVFMDISDGISNSERGIATWGEFNGRNQQQGRWFQWFQGLHYPLVSNNNGQWLFNPNNSIGTLPTIGSTIDIAGNLTIGNYVGTSAPTDGLIVSGTTGLGTASPSSAFILDIVGDVRSQGIFTTYGTSPETRWTSTDLTYGNITRSSSNNAITFDNQVLQVGGIGNAIKFNGINQSYNVADTGLPYGTSITLTVAKWVKMGISSTQAVPVIFYGAGTNTFEIFMSSTGGFAVFNGTTNLSFSGNLGVPPISSGWHHIGFTVDGTTAVAYVDGNSFSGVIGNYQVTLGGTLDNHKFQGITTNYCNYTEDQLLIWNTALTTGNFIALYAAGAGTSSIPSLSTCVRRYEHEDGIGATTSDSNSIGNKYNLTLFNSPTWVGAGNAIVPIASSSVTGTYLTYSDGINAGEKGQAVLGNFSSGTRIQGRTIKHLLNTNGTLPYVAFYQNFNGKILINPTNVTEEPSVASTLDIAGNQTIGFNYAGVHIAPSNGLLVQGNSLFGTVTDNLTDQVQVNGDINLVAPGNKLKIATGSNASIGTAMLSGGTVTINTNSVTVNSIIMLSYRNPSGTIGTQLSQGTIVAGSSFVVNSLDTSSSLVTGDNNSFNWWIIN